MQSLDKIYNLMGTIFLIKISKKTKKNRILLSILGFQLFLIKYSDCFNHFYDYLIN